MSSGIFEPPKKSRIAATRTIICPPEIAAIINKSILPLLYYRQQIYKCFNRANKK